MDTKITKTGVTNDKISARGGLPLFLRYIENIGLYGLILRHILTFISINRKGLQLQQFLKQMFAFYIDGTDTIIQKSHERGADELIHRSIKELATKEQLPFKSFGMNRAYYFLLVITHFIFEAYKQDVTHDVVPIMVYPNTFRRKLIDFAAKITSRSRYIILNVTRTIHETINIIDLWERCQCPPKIQYE